MRDSDDGASLFTWVVAVPTGRPKMDLGDAGVKRSMREAIDELAAALAKASPTAVGFISETALNIPTSIAEPKIVRVVKYDDATGKIDVVKT